MATFPIVSDNEWHRTGVDLHDLPAFYMEDFTRLGFRVSDCDEAIRILEQQAFFLIRMGDNAAVCIGGTSQVSDVVRLLTENGVRCDITDVAGGMYQG